MKEYAGKVLMLVESAFPLDSRVRKEALHLSQHGYKVSVICLKSGHQKNREHWKGISIYRLPRLTLFKKNQTHQSRRLQKYLARLKSTVGYSFEYLYFTLGTFFFSVLVLFKEGFKIIHAHNPPDTIFLWAAVYKVFGKKFVFDHHDLAPDMYLARFRKENDIVYKCLLMAEKFTCRTADVIIATNQSYREIEILRNRAEPDKIFIVRNGPDLDRLVLQEPDPKLKALNKTIIGYVGMMNPQDGIDHLIRSLYCLKKRLGRNDFFCVLIGHGDELSKLKQMARDLDLTDYVFFTGFIPDRDMLRYLSTADICVDSAPYNAFTNHSTWIKVLEYMALAKPIVSFDLKETKYSAQDAAVYVKPNDDLEFAKAIETLMDSPEMREEMGKYGQHRIQTELSWKHTSPNLLRAYSFLGAAKN
jgi:glycosyltransferase involved in cell wall biosynthesis